LTGQVKHIGAPAIRLTIMLCFYTGFVGFHQDKTSLYCSMQNTQQQPLHQLEQVSPRGHKTAVFADVHLWLCIAQVALWAGIIQPPSLEKPYSYVKRMAVNQL
jgi:hypothetical protein